MSPLVLTRDEEELIQCCRSLAQVSLVSVSTYRVVLRCLQVMAYLAINFPSRTACMMKRALHAAHQRESFACEPVNIAQKRQTLQVEQWYVDIEGTKKAATLKSQALEAVEITHTPVELTREALKQRQRVDADLRRILLVQSDHNSALAFLDHMDDVMTRKAKKKRLCHSLADPRDPSGPSNKRPRRSEESNACELYLNRPLTFVQIRQVLVHKKQVDIAPSAADHLRPTNQETRKQTNRKIEAHDAALVRGQPRTTTKLVASLK